MAEKKVKKGNTVEVEYEGKLEDGTVFDSSEKQGKPLEFEVGSNQLIKGFDKSLIGMKEGEEKEITLKPSEAYGQPNPKLVQKAPRANFPKEEKLVAGSMVIMSLPDGNKVPAKIVEVTKDKVTLDFNHPLAGKKLKFKIKLLKIKK